jgi:DNA topoisomerase-1
MNSSPFEEPYNLVIVESPSKCKKIEQYLNNAKQSSTKQSSTKQSSTSKQSSTKYKCIASYGHIRELKGLEAINISANFAPTFTECTGKKTHISKIRKAIQGASEVILGSDDDREGEAIAWHLCQVFNLSIENTKRILFHEITEQALQRAIETPTRVNMAIVNAQLARQVLDTVVGYKLSPLLWKHVKDGLSAGRCQTPALRLIYENQREIDKAPGKQMYVITGYFTNKNIPFVLNYEESDETQMQLFLNESLTYPHRYAECKLRNKISAPPEPFTTSTLQQTASNELHLSPKDTMAVCQSLYEAGLITYHRTDSKKYSEEFQKKARDYILKNYGEKYAMDQAQQTQVPQTQAQQTQAQHHIEQQPHEAIRMTDLKCEELDESIHTAKEIRMYRLIRRRTLESSMTEAILSVLTATISAPQSREYHYTTEQIVFAGWKIVSVSNASADSNKEYTYLQTIKPSIIPYKKIKATIHLREIKQHYTEARLIHLLEEKGIGRPSTFASLLDKIQERNYVKKETIKGKPLMCVDYEVEKDIKTIKSEREFGNEKNKLVITPVGIMALEFLLKHFDTFFQYSYTQQMEEDLDKVAKGEKIWYEVCRQCHKEIDNLSLSVSERGKETIRIDDEHTYMVGKYGPVIKYTGKAQASAGKAPAGKASAGKASAGKAPAVTFKAVRKDIDLNKLRRGEYTIEELLEPDNNNNKSIGNYEDKPVYIKAGKFGKYVEWNGQSKSLKQLKIDIAEITMDDVAEVLYDLANSEEVNLRIINAEASIRKGKFGNYIFYKNKKMKKPRFLKLDGFSGGDYLTCDLPIVEEWLKKTYKIDTIA